MVRRVEEGVGIRDPVEVQRHTVVFAQGVNHGDLFVPRVSVVGGTKGLGQSNRAAVGIDSYVPEVAVAPTGAAPVQGVAIFVAVHLVGLPIDRKFPVLNPARRWPDHPVNAVASGVQVGKVVGAE